MRRTLQAAVTLAGGLAVRAGAGLLGTEYNNIEYLCCDWGPALTLPSKTNAAAQFNDAEDEVYFLKQIGSFTRKPALLGGDIGHGISIWLCKMKADGSGKTEIKELWKNPNYPIDTQGQSAWLDVNRKTRKIALSITFAGSDITGLWTMGLDGSALARLIEPAILEGGLQSIDCPSWTPDGRWIVFGESLRGAKEKWGRISKCDTQGQTLVRFFNGPVDGQPHVSPDGNTIAYIHWVGAASRLYLMGLDGTGQQPLPNPDDKQWQTHGGSYPAWSADGRWILLSGTGIIDAKKGETIWRGVPNREGKGHSWGWAHWGKPGVIGYNLTGIHYTDNEIKTSKTLGMSRLVECSGKAEADRW